MKAKRLSASLCALVMAGSAVAAPVGTVFSSVVPAVVASAAENKDTASYWTYAGYKVEGDWVYDVSSDYYEGTYTSKVVAYIGKDKSVTPPSTLGGYTVDYIYGSLYLSSSVSTFTIPKDVGVNQYAFREVDLDKVAIKLTSSDSRVLKNGLLLNSSEEDIITYVSNNVTIPSTVRDIGYCSFSYWKGSSITIPKTVEYVGSEAFYGCENLTTVNWQTPADTIPENCFYNCRKLTNFKIPNTVKYIKDYAFTCSTNEDTNTKIAMTSIVIPESVEEIGYRAIGMEYRKETFKDDYGNTDEQWNYYPIKGFKIYCYPNSEGVVYAKKNKIPYEFVKTTPAKTDISKAKVTVAAQVYTGKAVTPAVSVSVNGKVLKAGTDYTVSYSNNTKCGQAGVVVTGKGSYSGTAKGAFIIKPKKGVLTKVTSPKAKAVKLVWKKNGGGVSGYQIKLGTNKKLTANKKVVTIKKGNVTSKTVTGLKKGKKYFAKIRAFKTVGNKKYYGAWSAAKSVKVKK